MRAHTNELTGHANFQICRSIPKFPEFWHSESTPVNFAPKKSSQPVAGLWKSNLSESEEYLKMFAIPSNSVSQTSEFGE
eukprot:COSAG02_NODE_2459_length_8804_cov_3.707295_5_plen_79_part_00